MTETSGAAEQAREKVQDVAGQAQEKAGQAADQAQGMVRKQVDQRTSDLGAQATSTSEDLRNIGEKLRDEGQDTPAQLADKAAEQTKRVGRYLADADADTLIADVEDLGRRQPMLVLAGGVVLGIAAARFLKASSSRRYEQSASNDSSSQAQQLPSGPSVSGYAATTSRGGAAVPTTQRPAETAAPSPADPAIR